MPDRKKGIVLDTHIWIWLVTGNSELSKQSIDQIEAARSAGVFVPSIVIWELATLAAKRRISLMKPTLDWVKEALSQPGVALAQLEPEIAVESTLLPGGFHGDPADRLIVSTARNYGLPIMTRDAKILAYGAAGYVHVIKA